MNARASAMATLAVATLLGVRLPATAQDPGGEPSSSTQEEEPPPQQEHERPPPTAGALPVDDPTMQPALEDEKAIEKPEESQPDSSEAENDHNVKVVYDHALVVRVDDWFTLTLGGLLQARYTVNYRTEPPTDPVTLEREKQVAQGFDAARARADLGIGLTEFVALFMRIGVAAGGDFSFQKAYIDLKWKYFRIRAGLFMQPTIAEDLIAPTDLYFLDYSIVDNVYAPGSSKGAMFTYLRERFSINGGVSDGLRTGFSEIRDAANADYAITVRTEYAWGEAGLRGFNTLTSRRGTPFGIRLGGALHYQDGGRTQGSLPARIGLGTVDLSMHGSGWSLMLAGVVGQDATDATASNEAGELVGGGVSLVGGTSSPKTSISSGNTRSYRNPGFRAPFPRPHRTRSLVPQAPSSRSASGSRTSSFRDATT